MARRQVASKLATLGRSFGKPVPELRMGQDGKPYVTDNGNFILDLRGVLLSEPAAFESVVDGLAGVVSNGLFARRGADVLLLARPLGVERYLRHA